jgi:30S ribosomal protein S31
MGKGDRKTAKGKRNVSSYGNARPQTAAKKAVTKAVGATAKAPAVAKKAPAKKAAK